MIFINVTLSMASNNPFLYGCFDSSLLKTEFTLCISNGVYGAYSDDYGYDAVHRLIMATG